MEIFFRDLIVNLRELIVTDSFSLLRRDVQMVRRGPERLAQGAIGTQVCSVLLNSPKLQDDPGSQASSFDEHRQMIQVDQTSISSNQACSVLVQAQSCLNDHKKHKQLISRACMA